MADDFKDEWCGSHHTPFVIPRLLVPGRHSRFHVLDPSVSDNDNVTDGKQNAGRHVCSLDMYRDRGNILLPAG